jgi:hypothetical protein
VTRHRDEAAINVAAADALGDRRGAGACDVAIDDGRELVEDDEGPNLGLRISDCGLIASVSV